MFHCAGDLVRLYHSPKRDAAATSDTKHSSGAGASELWCTLSVFDREQRRFIQPVDSPDEINTPILIHSDCRRVLAYGGVSDLAIAMPIPVVCFLTATNVLVLGTIDPQCHNWSVITQLQLSPPAASPIAAAASASSVAGNGTTSSATTATPYYHCMVCDGPSVVLCTESTLIVLSAPNGDDATDAWCVNAIPLPAGQQQRILQCRVLTDTIHIITAAATNGGSGGWSEWVCRCGVPDSLYAVRCRRHSTLPPLTLPFVWRGSVSKDALLLPAALKQHVTACTIVPASTAAGSASSDTLLIATWSATAATSTITELDSNTFATRNTLTIPGTTPVRRTVRHSVVSPLLSPPAAVAASLPDSKMSDSAPPASASTGQTVGLTVVVCGDETVQSPDLSVFVYASTAQNTYQLLASWDHVHALVSAGDDFLCSGSLQFLLHLRDAAAATAPAIGPSERAWNGQTGLLLTNGQTYWIGDAQHRTIKRAVVTPQMTVANLREIHAIGLKQIASVQADADTKQKLLDHSVNVLRSVTAIGSTAAAPTAVNTKPSASSSSSSSSSTSSHLVPLFGPANAAAGTSTPYSFTPTPVPIQLRCDEIDTNYCSRTERWRVAARLHNALQLTAYRVYLTLYTASGSEQPIRCESDCADALAPGQSAVVTVWVSTRLLSIQPPSIPLIASQHFTLSPPISGCRLTSALHSIEIGVLHVPRHQPPNAILADLLVTAAPAGAPMHRSFQLNPPASPELVPSSSAAAATALATTSGIAAAATSLDDHTYRCSVLLVAQSESSPQANVLYAAVRTALLGWNGSDAKAASAAASSASASRQVSVNCELRSGDRVTIRATNDSPHVEVSIGAPNPDTASQLLRALLAGSKLPPHTVRVNYATRAWLTALNTISQLLNAETKLAVDWLGGHLQSIMDIRARAAATSKAAAAASSASSSTGAALKLNRDLSETDLKNSLFEYTQFVRHMLLAQMRTDEAFEALLLHSPLQLQS